MFRLLAILFLFLVPLPAQLQVVTPYPLLADCAREIGGPQVEVELVASRDVHSFSPTASQLATLGDADLILLMGKGLEATWAGDLQATLGHEAPLLLVGDAVPDLEVLHGEAPAAAGSPTDPHWWQSVRAWDAAAAAIADELARLEPAHAEDFSRRAADLEERLNGLRSEYRRRLARVPRPQRYLAVPHAAYAFLCAEFGLQQIPLQGIGGHGEIPARHLQDCVELVRRHELPALFAERAAGRRGIEQLAQATGVPIGGELFADGDEQANLGVVEFLRQNLETIATGLGSPAGR